MLALTLLLGGAADPGSLTGQPGDPGRGRLIVQDRTRGLCSLCHAGLAGGDLAPGLAGVGARRTVAELRQRIADPRTLDPDTIMPAFFSTDGVQRVGAAWRGRTILTAAEVEDVVAYLATLRDDPP